MREIMQEDGTMMRTPELIQLAQKWNMKFITIKSLQEYRKRKEQLVERVACVDLPTRYGEFKMYGYINKLNGEHHIALVKGNIGEGENILCRVHSECLTGDAFGSTRCDCGEQLSTAMAQIEGEGRGFSFICVRKAGVSGWLSFGPTSCRIKGWTPWKRIWPGFGKTGILLVLRFCES